MIADFILTKKDRLKLDSLDEEKKLEIVEKSIDELLIEIRKIADLASQEKFYETTKSIDFNGFDVDVDFNYSWIDFLSKNQDDDLVKMLMNTYEEIHEEVTYYIENSES